MQCKILTRWYLFFNILFTLFIPTYARTMYELFFYIHNPTFTLQPKTVSVRQWMFLLLIDGPDTVSSELLQKSL